MSIRSILPALCILIISCGKKSAVPSQFIQPAKMQLVFWDFLRADALNTQLQRGSNAPGPLTTIVKLQKEVFAIHHVTREEFYSSLDYYKTHALLMATLMDSMLTRANRERPGGSGVITPTLIQ